MRRLQSVAIALCLLLVGLNVLTGNGGIGNDDLANADSNSPLAESDPPLAQAPPLPSTIKIWEAWAKGYVTITQGDMATYVVTNNGPSTIIMDEYTMLLNPSPANPSEDLPGIDDETQDGVLTIIYTVPPGGTLTHNYGDLVIMDPVSYPPPAWWCTEDTETVNAGIEISLGGEILPYDLWAVVERNDEYTQGYFWWLYPDPNISIWGYFRNNPTLVIGKTPLWKEIADIGDEVDITLEITNIGFLDATNVVVTDTVPSGYSYDPASFTQTPSSIITNPDGSTTLKWSIAKIDAAVETGYELPTDYATVYIGYKLITPGLNPDIRVFLPRAYVDKNNDGVDDAESEEPLLETYLANKPPVAVVDDVEIFEGQTAVLDGSSSYDPNEAYGDYIMSYEWDFDGDGSPDAFGSTASLPYGDNGNYTVTLTVTDSYGASSSTTATVTVLNVDPEITSIDVSIIINAPRTQGYWSHQCTVTEPYGDHTGILQEWIDSIAAQSQVFAGISSEDEVCTILDERSTAMSNMLAKAKLQLIALWLNVVSGKLSKDTPLDLPSLTASTTVGEAIDEIESVILASTDRSELERVKDIADCINNFLGIPEKIAEITAVASDSGSDDSIFNWSFGAQNIFYNDGVGPDPYPSPWGTYPFEAPDTELYSYSGSQTITLTVTDDDGGSTVATISLA